MITIRIIIAVLMCIMVSTTCLADDHLISPSQLPPAAQHFIHHNFRGQRIAYVEVGYDHGCVKYEVKLTNGTELKFDAWGHCYKVDNDDEIELL